MCCTRCGHLQTEVIPDAESTRALYGRDYFFGGGAGYADYLAEANLLRSRGKKYGELLRRYASPGEILDVGAAAGFVLDGFRTAGWDGLGLEPNEEMVKYGRESLGLEMLSGTLEELSRILPVERQFDAISMVQVIGHFFDVRSALKTAADRTRPGGFWLIETWNRASITARMFGRRWHEYSPPSVVNWFTPDELTTLADQFGFDRVAGSRTLKWINVGHAKSLVLHKLGTGTVGRLAEKAGTIIPDNWAVPYPGEDLFWAIYRKRPG